MANKGQYGRLYSAFSIGGGLMLFGLAFLSIRALDQASANSFSSSDKSLWYIGLFNSTLLVLFCIQLTLANLTFRATRNGVYFIHSCIFFGLFMVVQYLWLTPAHFSFTQETGIWTGGSQVGFIIGLFKWMITIVISTVNYLIIRNKFR